MPVCAHHPNTHQHHARARTAGLRSTALRVVPSTTPPLHHAAPLRPNDRSVTANAIRPDDLKKSVPIALANSHTKVDTLTKKPVNGSTMNTIELDDAVDPNRRTTASRCGLAARA